MLCALYVKKIEKKDRKKDKVLKDEQIKLSCDSPDINGLKESINSINSEESTTNFLEESISMLERTSMKLYPIVKEVLKRMIDEGPLPQSKNKEPNDFDLEKLMT